MPKDIVYTAISQNPSLHAMGFSGSEVYGTRGMENTTSPKFIVLRWGQTFQQLSAHGNRLLTVWVYDEGSSYIEIDGALDIIKNEILLPMANVAGRAGRGLSQVSWNGDSEELYDDIMKRITRNAVFTVNPHNS